jgi:hypothetical protein
MLHQLSVSIPGPEPKFQVYRDRGYGQKRVPVPGPKFQAHRDQVPGPGLKNLVSHIWNSDSFILI